MPPWTLTIACSLETTKRRFWFYALMSRILLQHADKSNEAVKPINIGFMS